MVKNVTFVTLVGQGDTKANVTLEKNQNLENNKSFFDPLNIRFWGQKWDFLVKYRPTKIYFWDYILTKKFKSPICQK